MNTCFVRDIITVMRQWAPEEWAEDFDNPGLIIGWADELVKGIYIALDPSKENVKKAAEMNCNLVITHHPLFIGHAFKSLTDSNLWEDEQTALFCASKRISLYAAHTNLDCAHGGVNDIFCSMLELKDVNTEYSANGHPNMYRIALLPHSMRLEEAAKHVAEKLKSNGIEFVGDPDTRLNKVMVCGGAGGSFIELAINKHVDVLITGEAKHHERIRALDNGLSLIVAGHYETEYIVLQAIRDALQRQINLLKYNIPIVLEQKQMINHRIVI